MSVVIFSFLTVAILDTGWHAGTHRVYEPLGGNWSEMMNSWWHFDFVGGKNYIIFRQTEKHCERCMCWKLSIEGHRNPTQNKQGTVSEVVRKLRNTINQIQGFKWCHLHSVCLSISWKLLCIGPDGPSKSKFVSYWLSNIRNQKQFSPIIQGGCLLTWPVIIYSFLDSSLSQGYEKLIS